MEQPKLRGARKTEVLSRREYGTVDRLASGPFHCSAMNLGGGMERRVKASVGTRGGEDVYVPDWSELVTLECWWAGG